ncbi:ferric reductase-like transmembrane domain-containing protein [Alicyclobacillus fastidiosus]|uniref:Ferric reductase-like transmembrane domain-containing protein n=1 Tax=Alicyclobacillus fastidiosus TaxID=392011 RepID=A0ABV5AKA0_9BACL|nr:ferric reductase-like transmembrane domain-containing protein [Alicyclobacillus fastidiosus]WEH09053.1 ferric reductase-like transmembrane domain-containing protein [Alicyclobacillus fastidiosus]
MQLINEQQRFPLIYTCLLVFIVIAGANVVTHVIDPAPATANELYWYMARSSGFTSYGLLSLAVLLGASSSSGVWDRLKLRKLITQVHQYSAILVFPFLFFHLWGLYSDKSILFTWTSILVPFVDSYRVVPTGLGILVLYGWILLIVTSYFREKIGVKVWRVIHIVSFPMFILVTLHSLLSGSDTGKLWSSLVYLVPSVLFVILVFRRFASKRPRS